MSTRIIGGASLVLFLFTYQLQSQQPEPARALQPFPLYVAEQDKQPDKDKKQPGKDKKEPDKKAPSAPQTDIFGPSPNDMGQVMPGFTPNMMGWNGPMYFAAQRVGVVGVQTPLTAVTTSTIFNLFSSPPEVLGTTQSATQGGPAKVVGAQRVLAVPIATRGAFEIGDNESPMPQDRVFVTYNNYSSVIGPVSESRQPIVVQRTVNNNLPYSLNRPPGIDAIPTSATTTTATAFPGAPAVTLNREVFGFEKTFFDGRASVELRVPFLQQPSSFGGFDQFDTGDLTIIGKYALYLDRNTGNVISGGVAVTAPTGPAIATVDGTFRDTLVQPFIGYLWNFDRFYVQAFHSVVIPTDARDVTILFNDVGFGYWIYKSDSNRFLTSIVPSVEAHVATPLDHRGAVDNPLLVPDIAAVTAGINFGFFRNATLAVGVTTPVTAPRIYGIESFVQLNWRF